MKMKNDGQNTESAYVVSRQWGQSSSVGVWRVVEKSGQMSEVRVNNSVVSVSCLVSDLKIEEDRPLSAIVGR
jgi:hypothetical protein